MTEHKREALASSKSDYTPAGSEAGLSTYTSHILKTMRDNPDKWFTAVDFLDPQKASIRLADGFRNKTFERRPYVGPVARIRFEYRLRDRTAIPAKVESTPEPTLEDLSPTLTQGISQQGTEIPPCAEPAPLVEVQGSSIEKYAQEFAVAIRSLVFKIVDEAIGEALGSAVRQLAPSVPSDNVRAVPSKILPRILIIGLKPPQQQQIRSSYGEIFDLRFFYDENLQRLDSLASNAVAVFAVLDALSHNVPAILKNHPNFKRVPGGLSTLMRCLDEFTLQEVVK